MKPGTKFGSYEIVGPIAAGGMGEVYRAQDTRLCRTVAIKILPAHIAASDDMRKRFVREARAISSLNHPHICVLYDIGSVEGTDFMVMEYLDGETLADRLNRGALPLPQALEIAIETSDALDRAHRSGVVHRDVKPGNIMLTRDGVKVLDFGLAKAQPVENSREATLTTEAVIYGTPEYMAPERIEGAPADERCDVFALGCVVYETLTGRRAFEGKTAPSVTSAILSGALPPMDNLGSPVLERFVRRCLAKDPDDRWQSMRDVVLELRSIAEASPSPPIVKKAGGPARWLWGAVILAILLTAGAAAFLLKAPPEQPRFHFSVYPPRSTSFLGSEISPDGKWLALVVREDARRDARGVGESNPSGIHSGRTRNKLWLRRMDSGQITAIEGSEGAEFPFWSPDSRFVGFFTSERFTSKALWKVEVPGGSPQMICEAEDGRGATWNAENVIVFSAVSSGLALARVSADGGVPVPVTTLNAQRREFAHSWPHFLPDGRHFLYMVRTDSAETTNIRIGSLDSDVGAADDSLRVASSKAIYAPPLRRSVFGNEVGHLLFMRGATLLAQPFEPKSRKLVGKEFTITRGIYYLSGRQAADFSASQNGTLSYGAPRLNYRQLVWRDRNGKHLRVLGPPGILDCPALSPDGAIVAFSRREDLWSNADLWSMDIGGTEPAEHITFLPQNEFAPLWSRDGTQLAFTSGVPFVSNVYHTTVPGWTAAKRLTDGKALWYANDWSRDGRFLLVSLSDKVGDIDEQGKSDLMVLPMNEPELRPIPLLETPQREYQGRFSPAPAGTTQWVAYVADGFGVTPEIYVTAFTPGAANKPVPYRVSKGAGAHPRWRGDGRELFYLSRDGKMMSVSVTTRGSSLEFGKPSVLFPARIRWDAHWERWGYDVTPDGQRFLLAEPVEGPARPVTLTTNWQVVAGR